MIIVWNTVAAADGRLYNWNSLLSKIVYQGTMLVSVLWESINSLATFSVKDNIVVNGGLKQMKGYLNFTSHVRWC